MKLVFPFLVVTSDMAEYDTVYFTSILSAVLVAWGAWNRNS